jgi:hypothetical protein
MFGRQSVQRFNHAYFYIRFTNISPRSTIIPTLHAKKVNILSVSFALCKK